MPIEDIGDFIGSLRRRERSGPAGTSRLSALAVLRLMTSSYLVGNSTGRSPAFRPSECGSRKRQQGGKLLSDLLRNLPSPGSYESARKIARRDRMDGGKPNHLASPTIKKCATANQQRTGTGLGNG